MTPQKETLNRIDEEISLISSHNHVMNIARTFTSEEITPFKQALQWRVPLCVKVFDENVIGLYDFQKLYTYEEIVLNIKRDKITIVGLIIGIQHIQLKN